MDAARSVGIAFPHLERKHNQDEDNKKLFVVSVLILILKTLKVKLFIIHYYFKIFMRDKIKISYHKYRSDKKSAGMVTDEQKAKQQLYTPKRFKGGRPRALLLKETNQNQND